jgi:2-dehydropantoate 2-reductase
VLGAAGGVGIAAIEIGKALGARVIACASSAEKLEVCRQHGADETINYATEDLRARIKDLTEGKGVDVIYDAVGGPYTEPAFRSIAWRGRLLVIGFAAGEIPKLPLNLALLKGASIVGVFWGDYTRREPKSFVESAQQLARWYGKGRLKPHVSATFPLEKDRRGTEPARFAQGERQGCHRPLIARAPAGARVIVVGAGAIGAFYASVLARAGCEVSVVARSDYDAVRRDGYRIRSEMLGDLSFRPAQVVRDAQEYRGEADYVLCALKHVRGVDRAALIRPALAPRSAIVLVQNGIDVEREIVEALPANELISAVAYAAVSREAPGHVVHHSGFTRLVIGNYPNGVSAAVERLAALVKAGGTSVQATDDIVGARWRKCAWNTVFNPISALGGGLGTRDILASDATTRFAKEAIEEVCAIRGGGGPSASAGLAGAADQRHAAPAELHFQHGPGSARRAADGDRSAARQRGSGRAHARRARAAARGALCAAIDARAESQPLGLNSVAAAERPLHDHGVDPAAELETDRAQRAGAQESHARVQADGRGLRAIADHRDQLAGNRAPRSARSARRESPCRFPCGACPRARRPSLPAYADTPSVTGRACNSHSRALRQTPRRRDTAVRAR